MVTAEQVKERLNTLNPTHLDLVDITANMCSTAFELVIVSKEFESSKLMIKRHRMVHQALGDYMDQIHAFSQKTYTPAEWEKLQSKN